MWSALPRHAFLPACCPARLPWLCPCLPGFTAAFAASTSFLRPRPMAARTSQRRVWDFRLGDRTPQTDPAHTSGCPPYRTECTESPVTSEAKRRKVRFAVGWGTAWEVLRVLSTFTCFLRSALPWGAVLPACRPACVPWLCPCLPGTPAALAIFDSFFHIAQSLGAHLGVASGTTSRATGLPTQILHTLLADDHAASNAPDLLTFEV